MEPLHIQISATEDAHLCACIFSTLIRTLSVSSSQDPTLVAQCNYQRSEIFSDRTIAVTLRNVLRYTIGRKNRPSQTSRIIH